MKEAKILLRNSTPEPKDIAGIKSKICETYANIYLLSYLFLKIEIALNLNVDDIYVRITNVKLIAFTVCPRSFDPFFMASIKLVKTSIYTLQYLPNRIVIKYTESPCI